METQLINQQMGNKHVKIRNLDWFGSVWRITTVSPIFQKFKLGNLHMAPFPEELVYRLISLYSKERDYVLDPFCGSGTTNFVALSLNRKTIGYDIEWDYIGMTKKRCRNIGLFFNKSSEDMKEVYNNSIQLCITSPPYLNVRKYSDNPKNIGNMENPYPSLEKVFKEIYRVLKPQGYFCLNVAGVADKGYLKTFPFDLIHICKNIGFKFRSSIIWDKGLMIKDWNIENKVIVENHEYIWVFRK